MGYSRKKPFEIIKRKNDEPFLLLNSEWDSSLLKIIKKENIRRLHIGEVENLEFLKILTETIDNLLITNLTLQDISAVHYLTNLKKLTIRNFSKTVIDLSKFPLLESFTIDWIWKKRIRGLSKCKNLRLLKLYYYPHHELGEIAEITTLEDLGVGNGPLRNLKGIENLKKLKSFSVSYCRNITSLDELTHIPNLEELKIESCSKITNINFVSEFKKLKLLHIVNLKHIESLRPLQHCPLFEDLTIEGWKTKVLDGDLHFLLELPNLKRCFISNRRHYKPKADYIEQIIRERHPDAQIEFSEEEQKEWKELIKDIIAPLSEEELERISIMERNLDEIMKKRRKK